MKISRCRLLITFLLPKWIVYSCGLRLLNHYTKGEVWSKDKLEHIRLTSALNRWKGNDGTETRFKKGTKRIFKIFGGRKYLNF